MRGARSTDADAPHAASPTSAATAWRTPAASWKSLHARRMPSALRRFCEAASNVTADATLKSTAARSKRRSASPCRIPDWNASRHGKVRRSSATSKRCSIEHSSL